MKKLFISQPMSSKSLEQIKKDRAQVISDASSLLGDNFEVLDNIFEDLPEETDPLWRAGRSLALLSIADVVIFSPGWAKDRECKLQHQAALDFLECKGVDIIEWQDSKKSIVVN